MYYRKEILIPLNTTKKESKKESKNRANQSAYLIQIGDRLTTTGHSFDERGRGR